jgi:hypothetical protein
VACKARLDFWQTTHYGSCMILIRIEKVASVDNGLPPQSIENHIAGNFNKEGYSLPISYNLEGKLLSEIKIGSPVIVFRTKRNGIIADGMFQTSAVIEVGKNYFKTANSIYTYKYL